MRGPRGVGLVLVALAIVVGRPSVARATEAPQAALDNVDAQLELATSLASAKKTSEAVRVFHDILQREPEHARAHLLLGDVYLYQLQDYDQALEHFLRAAGSDDRKTQALAREQAGDILMMAKNDWAAAAEQYRRVLAIWPNHIKTHYNLGGCLANAGQFEEAVTELEVVIKLAPKAEDPEMATRAQEAIAAIRDKQSAATKSSTAKP